MLFQEKYPAKHYIEYNGRDAIIIVRDEGNPRIWKGLNTGHKKVIKYRVDNGLITSKTLAKCDYAVWIEGENLYLIELKGTDYRHALEQIENSLDMLIIKPNISTNSVNGRIVLSRGRIPNIRYSREPAIIKKLKKLNGSLISKTNLLEEKI